MIGNNIISFKKKREGLVNLFSLYTGKTVQHVQRKGKRITPNYVRPL